jgi:hypothetical protein
MPTQIADWFAVTMGKCIVLFEVAVVIIKTLSKPIRWTLRTGFFAAGLGWGLARAHRIAGERLNAPEKVGVAERDAERFPLGFFDAVAEVLRIAELGASLRDLSQSANRPSAGFEATVTGGSVIEPHADASTIEPFWTKTQSSGLTAMSLGAPLRFTWILSTVQARLGELLQRPITLIAIRPM